MIVSVRFPNATSAVITVSAFPPLQRAALQPLLQVYSGKFSQQSEKMWRRNAFPETQDDSDQSISEEEDGDWVERPISLGGPAHNKGGMQLLSHLKKLADSHQLNPNDTVSIFSPERKKGVFIDDEVENSLSEEEGNTIHVPSITSACHSSKGLNDVPAMASISHFDEEIISDDEKVNPSTLGSAKAIVGGAWFEASREVDALVRLHKNSGCSSSQGGSGSKPKSKFLFHFQSHLKDQTRVFSDGEGKTSLHNFPLPSEISAAAHVDMTKVMAGSQLIFHEKEAEQLGNFTMPSELVHNHDSKEHSVAEFLDCLQERSGLMRDSLTDVGKRGRTVKMVRERNMFPLGGHENLDDDEDDPPEALDSGPPTPCDDEKNLLLQENPESLKPNISGRTMADQFHEALGAMSALDGKPHYALPKASCGGLFGKLQQVMQSEKESDTTYLKILSAEANSMVEKSISVRILSRSLEAKVTVCSCTCLEDEKNKCESLSRNSYLENNFQMAMESERKILSIIFSPRVCSDVELERGNLIRIHPPWKEVTVKGKDEAIILCSYFSQIQS